MKRVYIGNTELTTIATVTNGGGGGDDTQKWVDYFNGNLTEFTVPEGVTKIKDYAFYNCTHLSNITIPNNLTSIGEHTFGNCSALTSIIIPSSVTKIARYAFMGCSKLTGITIPNSVTSINEGTFQECSSLTSVTISANVTNIGQYAFAYCSSLTSVTIPANVTSIDWGAFQNCTKLTEMTVKATTPPSLSYNVIPDATKTIYVPASSVDAYKAADKWKNYADKIQAMPTPAMKVTYKDDSEKTFYNSIHIDSDTDSNKHNAKNVEIYDGVTTIRDNAFDGCTSLTSITIPSTITYIGQSILNGCTSLSNIIYQGTMANWNKIKFHGSWHDGVPSTTVVTCSDGTVKL